MKGRSYAYAGVLLMGFASCTEPASAISETPHVLREDSGLIVAYNNAGMFFGEMNEEINLKAAIEESGYEVQSSGNGCLDYQLVSWTEEAYEGVRECGDFVVDYSRIYDQSEYDALLICNDVGPACSEFDKGIAMYSISVRDGFLVQLSGYRDGKLSYSYR